jgi:poly-gamma-glutamate synthesis protein (capsule biosynthesis protein)
MKKDKGFLVFFIATVMMTAFAVAAPVTGRKKPAVTTLTVSAVGDCVIGYDDAFGTDNRFDTVYKNEAKGDPAYFFANVKSILAADDLTIANLESTFTDATKKNEKAYRFKGPPEYVRILEKGSVEAVNIANNHMYDYLQKGFDDTVATLKASRVKYFGYDTLLFMERKGIRIGMAGFHMGPRPWVGRKAELLEALEKLRAGADLVIVSYHWGIEGNYMPMELQKSLARFTIDNGAHLVLGHHPHVLQGIGRYKGRTIAYSLGNFCFGGNRYPKVRDTMILQQTFEFGPDGKLTGAEEPKIIPASVSSVGNRNDYRPTVLTGAEGQRVEAKIRGISRGL